MNPPSSTPIKYLIYARKSAESEDKQVASIDSQIKELQDIAQRDNLEIIDVLSESKSAKAPGRPVFGGLIARVSRGDANGILCWKLDRLARNPVDGGNISWMLQQGLIQHLQTHERGYYPTDNVLMMAVELGMANQFIRDLSENTKRGLRAKVEQGWYPGVAKPGYLNEFHRQKGERTTPKDPILFRLLRRAFNLILAGQAPSQILDKLNNEWGFRTLKRRKLGNKPLARSTLYRILADPFYYGRFEYPEGSGNWYQGKHTPMITEDEFWHMQELLGKEGRPRPQKRTFAFTGLMSCGECNAAITAHAKEQVICSVCKRKFACKNRSACPACNTNIAEMRAPKHLHYEYYHCTKRKIPSCSQGALEVKKLEAQVSELLASLTIPERLKDWYLKQIENAAETEIDEQTAVRNSLQDAIDDSKKRVNNLLALKISSQNSNGDLLSDEEFAAQRTALTREMNQLKQKMASIEKHADHWRDACAKTFNFACCAEGHFKNGSPETKRAILAALGLNLTLMNKKPRISLHKHFILMQKIHQGVKAQNGRFEP